MGKGNVSGQPQQPAPAQPPTSIPGAPPQQLGVFGQQPDTSAHPLATAGMIASTQQLSAPGAHVTTYVPRPPQPFRVMPSSTSSVSSGHSLAAGLQEAMQQLQLQPSSSTPAPAGTGSSRQPPGQMHPRASQDSSDLAHLLGQAQQQAQQQEQTEEDGPATVCASSAWLLVVLAELAVALAEVSSRNPAAAETPGNLHSMCLQEALSLACSLWACLVSKMSHSRRLLPLPCVVQLFFAKVPRSATSQQIQEVFARFGEVESLNLFVPFEVSPRCWKLFGLPCSTGQAHSLSCARSGSRACTVQHALSCILQPVTQHLWPAPWVVPWQSSCCCCCVMSCRTPQAARVAGWCRCAATRMP